MDLELTRRPTPVSLAPGVPPACRSSCTTGPPRRSACGLRSPAAGPPAGPRRPAGVTVAPARGHRDRLVLQTAADQPPSSSLVPFTVHAEEARPANRPASRPGCSPWRCRSRSSAIWCRGPRPRHTYDLRLVNETRAAGPLRVTARAGRRRPVSVQPDDGRAPARRARADGRGAGQARPPADGLAASRTSRGGQGRRRATTRSARLLTQVAPRDPQAAGGVNWWPAPRRWSWPWAPPPRSLLSGVRLRCRLPGRAEPGAGADPGRRRR